MSSALGCLYLIGDTLRLFLQIMTVTVDRLKRYRALTNRDPQSLSKFAILKARDAFRQNPPETLDVSSCLF